MYADAACAGRPALLHGGLLELTMLSGKRARCVEVRPLAVFDGDGVTLFDQPGFAGRSVFLPGA